MKLEIKNFRSIREQEVDLTPITLVYGANGAGKSSLLYALLTLKNLILNPNQNPSGFFNYTFASLGSFEAVVFDHNTRSDIELGVTLETAGMTVMYQVAIGEKKGHFILSIENKQASKARLELPVPFPYPANEEIYGLIKQDQRDFKVIWNGITTLIQAPTHDPNILETAGQLATSINSPIESLRRVSIIPLKRGFSKPHYSPVPVFHMLTTEDEVATMLSNDKYLVSKVSVYLEQIFERDFRVNVTPGTAIFSIDTTDKRTGVVTELVNEGFGVNQIVYILARCLHRDAEWVCIEEPEIHLHPTAVRGVAKTLAKITRDEGKRFLISTHSESFLSALLTLVAKGELNPSDLSCYFARKERKTTQFERQAVNEKGQIEGGLTSFIEGELDDIKTFLKVDK